MRRYGFKLLSAIVECRGPRRPIRRRQTPGNINVLSAEILPARARICCEPDTRQRGHADCSYRNRHRRQSWLRAYAGRLAANAGIDLTGGRVRLLCYRRLLGYALDPLSVYYCEDERRNPHLRGAQHLRREPHLRLPGADGRGDSSRQKRDKLFYVSPFIGMGMRYHFRMLPPAEAVKIRILETDADGPLLSATFVGRRHALTNRRILSAFFTLPLMTLKVIGGIHFQAVRLWLKGVKLHPRSRDEARAPSERTAAWVTVR